MLHEIAWPIQAGVPVLSLLIGLPLLAMALAWAVRSAWQAFLLGFIAASAELALALGLLGQFSTHTADYQFVEKIPLTSVLHYHLGLDGIGILFVVLTALLTLLVILYGEIVHEKPAGLYVSSVFAFEAAAMGLFLSIDLLEFWIVCVLETIPAGFILYRWGIPAERRSALRRYLQDIGGGLILLLCGLLIVGSRFEDASGYWSFALTDLTTRPLGKTQQALPFLLMLFGLAPRLCLFPFHAWLPVVAQYGPLATLCVFLVGLKVGVFALLRFVLPLFPDASADWKSFVVTLASLGIFYGALLALMQINLRRLLAFAAVSHSSLLAIGVFCLNREGMQGSLLLAVNFGMAAAGLLFVCGAVHRLSGTALLPRLGGLFERLPVLGLTFLIAALSTMAMPGTPGFDAAHLMLEGALEAHHWGIAVIMASGSVASAAFLLWAFQRAFLAEPRDRFVHAGRDRNRLSLPELVLAAIICAVLLLVGFYTEPWLEIIDESVTGLARQLSVKA